MKKQIFVLIILMLALGCKKYEQKNLPVQAIYIFSGTADTIKVNGFVEAINAGAYPTHFIIESGRLSFGHSGNGDTLLKDLWTGDKISISSGSFTSIYYKASGSQGYLVDSSANHQASITVGDNY